MFIRRILGAFFAFFLVGLGGLGLWLLVAPKGFLPPTGSPLPAPAAVNGPDVVSTFTLVGHNETGRKKWEIQGETADLLAEKVDLSPVAATHFGQVDLHLTAEKGLFNRSTQNVHLEGKVVVTTSDGAKLTTDSLDWAQAKETGTTPDRVTVTRPGIVVVGTGGTGRPKLKRVRLEREVTVTLENDPQRTVITCNGPMEADYGRHKVRFWKNVKVQDAKGFILADRLDATLDSKTHQVEKATFWGHVRIHQEGKVATAQRAEYWQPLGHIQLVGHPKLVMISPEGKGLE